jgi:glucose-1-phosphatase
MITTVLFDMNDVLYRYNRRLRVGRLAALCGKAAAEVEAAIWESGYEDSGDEGEIDADAYLGGFRQRLGCELTVEQWAEALRVSVAPMPQTLRLAAAVAERAQVAVLTNNNLMVKRVVDAVFPELRPIFGQNVFVSAEFHARKPEPPTYLRCVARLGVAPESALFVDDSARNVAGAERAGLAVHLFLDFDRLRVALENANLLPR